MLIVWIGYMLRKLFYLKKSHQAKSNINILYLDGVIRTSKI